MVRSAYCLLNLPLRSFFNVVGAEVSVNDVGEELFLNRFEVFLLFIAGFALRSLNRARSLTSSPSLQLVFFCFGGSFFIFVPIKLWY